MNKNRPCIAEVSALEAGWHPPTIIAEYPSKVKLATLLYQKPVSPVFHEFRHADLDAQPGIQAVDAVFDDGWQAFDSAVGLPQKAKSIVIKNSYNDAVKHC
jgi:hypothetical protein